MESWQFRPTALALCALVLLVGCTAEPSSVIAEPAAVATADPSPPECEIDEALCGPRCVRITTDVRHCGACGYACASDMSCLLGHCVVGTPSGDPLRPRAVLRCRPDRAACGETCVDLATSRVHCGACGSACAGSCVGGACVPGGV